MIRTCGRCIYFSAEGGQYRRFQCMAGIQPITEADRVRNFCEYWKKAENKSA